MKEVQVYTHGAVEVVNAEDPIGLFKLAIESKAGADTLERVMAVRRELRSENAKAAFDRSMAAFQSECPIIVKKKSGAKNAYKYAPLDDIVSQVRDLIRKHGFSFAITSEIEPGWVKAVCTITHEMGHCVQSVFKVPVDSKNPMMSEPQRYGGAMTFSKRYAFANGFGILTADEDLDGLHKIKPAGPRQATDKTRIWMLQEIGIALHPKFLDWAHCQGYLDAGQALDEFPLEQVPVTAQALSELKRKIENHV